MNELKVGDPATVIVSVAGEITPATVTALYNNGNEDLVLFQSVHGTHTRRRSSEGFTWCRGLNESAVAAMQTCLALREHR